MNQPTQQPPSPDRDRRRASTSKKEQPGWEAFWRIMGWSFFILPIGCVLALVAEVADEAERKCVGDCAPSVGGWLFVGAAAFLWCLIAIVGLAVHALIGDYQAPDQEQ